MGGSEIYKEVLKIKAVDLKNKNIPLPDYLQKVYDEMTHEEKCECEIKLIEAEYKLKEGDK